MRSKKIKTFLVLFFDGRCSVWVDLFVALNPSNFRTSLRFATVTPHCSATLLAVEHSLQESNCSFN